MNVSYVSYIDFSTYSRIVLTVLAQLVTATDFRRRVNKSKKSATAGLIFAV